MIHVDSGPGVINFPTVRKAVVTYEKPHCVNRYLRYFGTRMRSVDLGT